MWACVMQLTAGRINYRQHLLFHLCWPKYLKLTSYHVDDSNEFMLQVVFGQLFLWTAVSFDSGFFGQLFLSTAVSLDSCFGQLFLWTAVLGRCFFGQLFWEAVSLDSCFGQMF